MREVAALLAEAMDRPDIEPEITGRYRVGDIRHCFADISLAREVLGYEPRVTFEEGMQELVAIRRDLATLMAAMLALAGVAWAKSTAQPVDPPKQVAQLRQQFEGLSTKQVKAQGYVPEGPCVPNPKGPGAMGIHAINHKLLQAQFPKGKMDPEKPPVLLLGQKGKVIGLEWEAADVGQGPMKMFGQTIKLQPGHPGVPDPHYMLHIYFKPHGKVLFGTNAKTAFDPKRSCRVGASS